MSKLSIIVITCLIVCTASLCRGEEAKLSLIYTGKVSALSLPGSMIGEDWEGPSGSGLVMDDLKDLSGHPARLKSTIEELRKLVAPFGVVGVADFTYRKNSNPPELITLRVFVFDTETSCQKWWAKRYRYDGWEKHYTVVRDVPYDAVDSTQMTKRAVAFGNIWMTCGGLEKTEHHRKALDLYINKIKNVAEGQLTHTQRPTGVASKPASHKLE